MQNSLLELNLSVSPKDINHFLIDHEITELQFFIGTFCVIQRRMSNQENIVIVLDDNIYELDVSMEKKGIDYIRSIKLNSTANSSLLFAVNTSLEIEPDANDIILSINQEENTYKVQYSYSSDVYSDDQLAILNLHWSTFINTFIATPQEKLRSISIVSSFEKKIISQVNDTDREYSDDLCVHERFSKTAQTNPNQIALEFNNKYLTYKELDKQSTQFANYLVNTGIGKGDFVGIMAPRGFHLIISMLGVMKAGATYLPLSKDIPLERIDFMLKTSYVKAIITTEDCNVSKSVKQINIALIDFDQLSSEEVITNVTPDDNVALIYTSGTTGVPKGVLVRHKSVVNYCEYNLAETALFVGSHVVQFAPFVFSTMIYEVASTLFSGSRLHLVEDDVVKDIRQFQTYINTHPINFLLLPSQYVDYIQLPESIDSIETGASNCLPETSDKINLTANHLHAYGLTEGAIVSVWKRSKSIENSTLRKVPIGKPVYNTKVFVLNEEGDEQGMYMPGELCVTGVAISNGYHNMPELTEQRFIDNPFGEGKMLKTGDLVEWNYYGELEYIGRLDNQVKIRGMRVELEEIEYQIGLNPLIVSTAVITKKDEDGNNYLVAFVVSKDKINLEKLKIDLSKRMLSYMIPQFIEQIEIMPLSPNGKIDKKKLNDIDLTRSNEVVAPATDVEAKLISIFSTILHIDTVGIDDSFFDLGGHSLNASKLVNEIEKELGIRLSFADIFKLKTPKSIGEKISNSNRQKYESILPSSKSEYYPLSPAQRRMYFVSKLEEQGNMYHLSYIVAVKGRLDFDKINNAFQELVSRHEIFRTSFKLIENESVQCIDEKLLVQVQRVNNRFLTVDTPPEAFKKYFKSFDLSKAPLIRLTYIEVADNNTVLLADIHHIISDGMSLNLLIQEMSDLYNGKELDSVTLNYKDYACWINAQTNSKEGIYWKEEFSNQIPLLQFPLDFPRPDSQSFRGKTFKTTISNSLRKKVTDVTQATGTTEYMVFLATLMILLSKYSLQDEIVVGSPVSGRVHKDTEKMFGLFINSLAMKGKPEGHKLTGQFLSEVKETCLNAYENQLYPFEQLVEELQLPRNPGRHPLFDVMLIVQNNEQVTLDFDGVETDILIPEETTAQYDLTFSIFEDEDKYAFSINYATDLFEETTIEYINKHFQFILLQLTNSLDKTIDEIITVTSEEEQLIHTVFNNTERGYNKEKTLPQLIEDQVRKTPNKEIIVFERESLTYSELNERANQVAHYLIGAGVKPNDFIILHTTRSLEMFIAILGIVKSGAAFIPVNTHIPEKRFAHILESINPKAILTYKSDIKSGLYNEIDLEFFDFSTFDYHNPNVEVDMNDPVYGIYTSGTTGQPKCVVITEKNMSNFCQTYAFDMKLQEINEPSLVSVSEYSFDIFENDCLFALVNSIKVYLANEVQAMDPNEFTELLFDSKAKMLGTTPSKFKFLTSQKSAKEQLATLEYLNVAGEKVPSDFLDYIRTIFNGRFINAYGPSEATIFSSYKEITANPITIGHPLSNYQIYIQNAGRLAGVGLLGEIAIAGDGIGSGYRGQPELTAEKFISNPYGEGMLYLSGDLGRWLPSGEIEIAGRIDNQVKLRGFRIELDEVEEVLRRQDTITDAVVVIRANAFGEEAISGYFKSSQTEDITQLKESLREELPEYMVPTFLMQLDQIPLNSNGKVDKNALPIITTTVEKQLIPFKNKTEEKVGKIFKEVLHVQTIGSNSNFFELGGNSLRLTSVSNHVETDFGQKLRLQDIYRNPTVSGISNLLRSKEGMKYEREVIPKAEILAEYPMSSAQQRQYVVNQLDDTGVAYNMPSLLKLNGDVDLARLQTVIDTLTSRHASLRTQFAIQDGKPIQIIKESVSIPIVQLTSESELDEHYEQKLLKKFVRPFDLGSAPLIRVAVTKSHEGTTYLLVDNHHIISDGESIKILLKEVFELYQDMEQNLSDDRLQYFDYSEWMNGKDMSLQTEYWKNELSGEIPILDLPLDYTRPVTQTFEGNTLTHFLDNEIRIKVERLSTEMGTTSFMTLLSVFMVLLGQQSYQEEVIVGSPVSGRTNKQIENTVGMFVNTLVLKGNVTKEKSFLELLNEVKTTVLGAIDNQDLPYDKIVELANTEAHFNRNPLFDVMFTYQDDEVTDSQLMNLNISEMVTIDSVAKFDLTITIAEKNQGYLVSCNYATSLFKMSSMNYFMAHFFELLRQVLDNPLLAIGDYSAVNEEEKELLLSTFNDTEEKMFLANNTDELFKIQVKKFGKKDAIIFGNQTVSYEELDRQIDNFATGLLDHGLEQGDLVALICSRSIEMVVAIMGVIRAGGAYIPIDPEIPEQRKNVILGEAKPFLLLTNINSTENSNLIVLNIREIMFANYSIDQSRFPTVTSSDIAYVLFTSGTTGKPKGVLIKQEGILNLQVHFRNKLNVNENDSVLQFASYAFDASVWEFSMALLNGGTLHLVNTSLIQDIYSMSNYIEKNISVVLLPPQYAIQLPIEELNLRILVTGGSAAIKDVIIKTQGISRFINAYGPTEATVCATFWELNDEFDMREVVPIGRPLSNSQAYILNGNKLAGVGVPGELCISGENLALGYLNLPKMTSESFVENPFIGRKMYRTGDLARCLPDGNIEYLGRIDRQVKIRGFRIEITEIEDALRDCPNVADCTVLVKKDIEGNPYLVGYVVMNNENQFDREFIILSLERLLPKYMVPSQIVSLNKLPVTISGKIDEHALPDVEMNQVEQYEEPITDLEKALVESFEEVLMIHPLSVSADFLTMGGDSIKAIRIVSKLREKKIKVTVKMILQNQTIRKIAQEIVEYREQNTHEQGIVSGAFPLTPIQDYFFENNFVSPKQFNQAIILEFQKSDNLERIKQTLMHIVCHHDGLRTVFNHGEQVIQDVSDVEAIVSFDIQDYSECKNELDIIEKVVKNNELVQESMDITKGPLVKAVYYEGNSKNYLFICIHHLVIDAVSWSILLDDFSSVYTQLKHNETVSLPMKTASMKEWSSWLQEYAKSDKLYKECDYWFKNVKRIESLPIQNKKQNDSSPRFESVSISLSKEKTRQLVYETNQAYNTNVNDLLLVALSRTIRSQENYETIAVQMEGHGRELFDGEGVLVDRTVGWFTSLYPVILDSALDIEQDIIGVKETIRQVPNHGFGYNILSYLTDYDLPNVTPKIAFNYLGSVGDFSGVMDEFKLSDVSIGHTVAPENDRGVSLTLTTKIESNHLIIELTYDLQLYSSNMIQTYLEKYEEELITIIDYCRYRDESVQTLSDLGVTDMEADDVDILNDVLDDLLDDL